MPTVITQGAASAKGYGFGASATAANYIEDVFSTYLYTGNGSTQTITNGINLSGKGGLVWTKCRSIANGSRLYDSERPSINPSSFAKPALTTNGTNGNLDYQDGITTFNADGFLIQDLSGAGGTQANTNGATYVSWTFRKQAKFFDIVTYTGNGANRTIAHSLGSVPGCIIVKRTSGVESWLAYHRSLGAGQYLMLNWADPAYTQADIWNNTAPTSTVFSLGTNSAVNASGSTYVAYLFAHDAGGFGATGSDNVISCGSYNGTGSSTVSVTLGFEPQWVLIKKATGSTFTDGSASWCVFDNMRGIPTGGSDACLYANLSDAENNQGTGNFINVTATGFEVPPTGNLTNQSACSYIYIAIRRGPMKTPTTGTSVFSPIASSAASNTKITTGFPVDTNIVRDRTASTGFQSGFAWADRLRSMSSNATSSLLGLQSTNTNAQDTAFGLLNSADNTGFSVSPDYGSISKIYYSFRRAPGFFDVVCYTGTGANRTVSHNLGVAPEMMIVKCRDVGGRDWHVYHSATGASQVTYLNSNTATTGTTVWNSTSPTSSVFSLGSSAQVNASGSTYVAYLFATVPGVSKVGSYSGSGTTKQIDCGFTNGARFVLIKRVDSGITSDWYVWDSARGIVAANDPYLLLNSTAAEVTNTDYIDTYAAGFEISNTAPAAINANGITYIYLAIA